MSEPSIEQLLHSVRPDPNAPPALCKVSDAAGHMAARAAIAEDREDIVVVGVLRRDRLVRFSGNDRQQRGRGENAAGNRDADTGARPRHG